MRYISITTISGVRGAVTLAGAFTIPYFLANGDVFPERSLIIFIAAGVILVTLSFSKYFPSNYCENGKRKYRRAERRNGKKSDSSFDGCSD